MARDIKLDWTNPAASDISNIQIFRAASDLTGGATYWDGSVSTAEQAQSFSEISGVNEVASLDYSAGSATFTETEVPVGVYTYGVFSKNSVGFGPGTLTTATVAS